jgi:hypothetical protein
MAKSTTRGVELYVENPATAGFIKVGNLTAIGVPGPTKPEVDVSDFDSVAAEFLPGIPDYGSLPFTVNYNNTDAGQEILFDDAQDPEAPVRTFRVDFTQQAERFEFDAYVSSFVPRAGGINQAITADGSLRVSGAVARSAIP